MVESEVRNERIARSHFERDTHEGPLVTCYHISEQNYLIAARPQSHLGHRLHAIVTWDKVNDKVIDYVGTLARNFTFDNLLMRDLEVFEGEVS